VPLAAPLSNREVIDGSTGRRPDDLDPFDASGRRALDEVLATDLDSLDCVPFTLYTRELH
jgi:hypothetical protein